MVGNALQLSMSFISFLCHLWSSELLLIIVQRLQPDQGEVCVSEDI